MTENREPYEIHPQSIAIIEALIVNVLKHGAGQVIVQISNGKITSITEAMRYAPGVELLDYGRDITGNGGKND